MGIKTAARPSLPAFIEPQLASLVPDAPAGDDWLHELKFDGYRILARLETEKVTLLSRRAKDWSTKFPGVRAAVAKLPARAAMLDGEVAVPLADGRTSFQALQNVLSRGGAGAVYYVFDLLWLDGRDLRDQPLEARKAALKELLGRAPRGLPVIYSDHVVGHGAHFLEQARTRGLEGIVSKRRSDRHRAGRSPGWLKIKCINRQEFVIGGYTEPEGSREALGALLIGYYQGESLIFAGKVGTGFTQKLLRDLRRRLQPLEQTACPFVERPPVAFVGRTAHWTRPELVGEVAFTEWTDDGRLRHPSFQGLREDKPARDVVRESVAGRGSTHGSGGDGADDDAAHADADSGSSASADDAEEPVRPAKRTSSKARPGKSPKKALKKGEVEVQGERLSHPDRVYYPESGITKLDLAHYYEAVGEAMLPHVQGRPLTLVRCPEGVAKHCFYVKHVGLTVSPVLDQIPIKESKKIGKYVIVDSIPGLVALAQMGMLEIHTWNSHREDVEHPDRFVLDLDPGPEVPWEFVVETARLCRTTLKQVGLEGFLRTTGGKGLHIVVPTTPELDWDQSLALSRAIAGLIVRQDPARYTTEMPKAGRERKILIDYLRNNRGATSIASFSTRAKPGATVAVPLAWEELEPGLRPDRFTVKTVPKRLASLRRDPWQRYFSMKQKVPRDLARLLTGTTG